MKNLFEKELKNKLALKSSGHTTEEKVDWLRWIPQNSQRKYEWLQKTTRHTSILILDKDGSGIIEFDEIKEVYRARNHPDVKAGKKTEDEVLLEFIETFEAAHNYLNGNDADGKVTLEEFIEYYENVSMSIDDDAYFELMMTNAWNLDNKPNYGKGWKNTD